MKWPRYARFARKMIVGDATVPEDTKQVYPLSFTLSSAVKLHFILDSDRPIPSTEWQEIAEYKLVAVRRVRYVAEWEEDKKP